MIGVVGIDDFWGRGISARRRSARQMAERAFAPAWAPRNQTRCHTRALYQKKHRPSGMPDTATLLED